MKFKGSRIGNNIRNLRISSGETSEELALSIQLYSPRSVSFYERGSKIPKKEILVRIAEHYRVPVELLINGDISSGKRAVRPFERIADSNVLGRINGFIPVAISMEAMRSLSFLKGLRIHYTLLREDDARKVEKDFKKCMKCYDDAFRKDGVVEAAANMLWWLLLIGLSVTKNDLYQEFMKYQRGEISREAFIRSILLEADAGDKKGKAQAGRERGQYLSGVQSNMLEMLRALKKSPKWSELADYYNALRYKWNLIDNDLKAEMNDWIGTMMIVSQAEIGNQYAAGSFYGQ